MPTVEEAETAFADLLVDYENLWIAYVKREGLRVIVGSGRDCGGGRCRCRGEGVSRCGSV